MNRGRLSVRRCSRRMRGVALFLLLSGLPALAAAADSPVWRLRGTFVTAAPEGFAIVEHVHTGEQRWLRRGQSLTSGGASIGAVHQDHVMLQEADGQRRLEFGTRIAREPRSDGRPATFDVARRELYEWVQVIDLIPHQREGAVVGYYANRIPPRLRARVGLQPGDVVHAVNGLALNGRTDPEALYEQARRSVVVLDVNRRGEPLQLVYRLH